MKFEWRSLVCRMVKVFFPSAAATTERARDSRRDGVSLPTRSCCCVVFIVVSFQWWLGFHGRKQQHCCRHRDRSYSSSHSSAFRNPTNMSNSPPVALLADRIHGGNEVYKHWADRSTSNTASSNGILSRPRR